MVFSPDRSIDPESTSESRLDLQAYSYCASDSEQTPNRIIWPETTDQVARFLRENNQVRGNVIIRGAGTNRSDCSIGKECTILSSERMNRMLRLDEKSKLVEVQSGMRISDLNSKLSEFGLLLPATTHSPVSTIGGLVAVDAATRENLNVKGVGGLINLVEFVDGTGKIYFTEKKELVVGKEGLSGFITRVVFKVIDRPAISLDMFTFDEITDLIAKVRSLSSDPELYFLELIDKESAASVGFEPKMLLVAAYSGLKGKYPRVADVRNILERLDLVYPSIRQKGYYHEHDPSVSLDKTYDLLDWCIKNKVPFHGHAAKGAFYAYFKKDDLASQDRFRAFLKDIGATLGSSFGLGIQNAGFASLELKKSLIKIKDEHDYNNTINPEKIISYR
jgi:FAD/FMN-containing dehydrogenase